MSSGKKMSLRYGGKEIATGIGDDNNGLECEVRNAAGAVRNVSLPVGVGVKVSPGVYEVPAKVAQSIQKFLEDGEAA